MHTIRFSALLILLGLFCSCEKVIDLKVPDSSPKYVIEGLVSNQTGGAKVTISLSKNFTDDNTLNGVSGALISVESDGTVYPFVAAGNGVYQNSTLTGIPGHTYKLTVNISSNTYTSTSIMPQPVSLDSVYIVTDEFSKNKDKSLQRLVTVKYKDPADTRNYYRFIQYIDNIKEKTIFVSDDEFTNGQEVNGRLNFSNDNDAPTREVRTGKQVRIEMQCIDAAVYKYFYSLDTDASGDSNNATPANPISNISGGVLGYFSAYTITSKTITVPPQ
ncbi:MAG: hypothetical protein JWR38_580 [Mucilaginibacter sp.]|nr:hypothetical protein [Mucilaginibacter sp.]